MRPVGFAPRGACRFVAFRRWRLGPTYGRMFRLRAFATYALIMLLALTGVGIGMARGAMAADGQFCSVTGPAPVVLAHDGLPLFDSAGAPVTLDRDACLDCLITAFDLAPVASGPTAPATPAQAIGLAAFSNWMPTRAAPGGQPRAPPAAA